MSRRNAKRKVIKKSSNSQNNYSSGGFQINRAYKDALFRMLFIARQENSAKKEVDQNTQDKAEDAGGLNARQGR